MSPTTCYLPGNSAAKDPPHQHKHSFCGGPSAAHAVVPTVTQAADGDDSHIFRGESTHTERCVAAESAALTAVSALSGRRGTQRRDWLADGLSHKEDTTTDRKETRAEGPRDAPPPPHFPLRSWATSAA